MAVDNTLVEKSMRSVFVGNIPYDLSDERLKEIFGQVGPVLSFRMMTDRTTGKPKGYGFCEFRDPETALSAMRNLNGFEIGGRSLRVDNACTEKSRMEMQTLLQGPSQESPYGEEVEPAESAEAITKAVASLPPEQMFELMKQMKLCIQNNPDEARTMLLQNPQLAYAMLQALVVMSLVDPHTAASILHKSQPSPEPLKMLDELPPRPAAVPVPTAIVDNGPASAAPLPPPHPAANPPPPRNTPFGQLSANLGQDVDFRMPQEMSVPHSGDMDMRHMDPRGGRHGDQDLRVPPREMSRGMAMGGNIRADVDLRAADRDMRDFDARAYGRHAYSHGAADMGGVGAPPPCREQPDQRYPPQDHDMRGGAPRPVPGVRSPGQAELDAGLTATLAGGDKEKAALIMQVLQLSDEQVAQLPAEQRHSITVLKQQIAAARHKPPAR